MNPSTSGKRFIVNKENWEKYAAKYNKHRIKDAPIPLTKMGKVDCMRSVRWRHIEPTEAAAPDLEVYAVCAIQVYDGNGHSNDSAFVIVDLNEGVILPEGLKSAGDGHKPCYIPSAHINIDFKKIANKDEVVMAIRKHLFG